MAKRRNGPWVAVAAFCDRVLQEQDGLLSAIRFLDTITVEGEPVEAASVVIPIQCTALIALKSGDMVGHYDLIIRADPPEVPGLVLETGRTEAVQRVTLSKDQSGVNHILNMAITAPFLIGGVVTVWFDVLLGDELLTRMPLRLVYTVAEHDPSRTVGPPAGEGRPSE